MHDLFEQVTWHIAIEDRTTIDKTLCQEADSHLELSCFWLRLGKFSIFLSGAQKYLDWPSAGWLSVFLLIKVDVIYQVSDC